MKREYRFNIIKIILLIYAICFGFREIEYMFLRTDQGILGEAVIHKVIGIVILSVALKVLSVEWREIGFSRRYPERYVLYGLLIGAFSFAIAYGAEFYIQHINGNVPMLDMYVTSYSISGNIGKNTGILFFAICIIGNIINVLMEEGLFRGLFLRLAERECTFFGAAAISSVLFGIWHLSAPIRSFIDGELNLKGFVIISIILFITILLAGVKFCLMTKLSGSLWMPMADHFFNNTIINTLHIVTQSGMDEMQIIRISIAQSISFIIVVLIYLKTKAWNKKTFR